MNYPVNIAGGRSVTPIRKIPVTTGIGHRRSAGCLKFDIESCCYSVAGFRKLL